MANIAVLSTAHIHTKGFLENIAKATDGRRIHAIWDDVPDRGRRYADTFGARFEPDIARVLGDGAVAGFIICAENTRHLPLLEQALPVGKPVFCEKPLTTTSADMRRALELVRKHGTVLHAGYFQPFSGIMQGVRRLLDEGTFGTVTRCRFRNAHHAAYGHWFDSPDLAWFHDPALAGGGALMDMGTHAVHLLRTLFGPVDEVWAMTANHAGVYPRVDDYGLVQLRFASGVLGTVEAAWTQTGGPDGLEIVGSERTLWNGGAGYVYSAPRQEAASVTALPEKPRTVDRLVAAIRGELTAGELAADLAAAADSVAIMEAAYASSRSGLWQRVASVAV